MTGLDRRALLLSTASAAPAGLLTGRPAALLNHCQPDEAASMSFTDARPPAAGARCRAPS
jgi:hypothetical protein